MDFLGFVENKTAIQRNSLKINLNENLEKFTLAFKILWLLFQ
jgi:hypothetical protein